MIQAAAAAAAASRPVDAGPLSEPRTPGKLALRSRSTWQLRGGGQRQGHQEGGGGERGGSREERQERQNRQRRPGTAAASARTRLGRLAFVEWEEAPRRGLLNRGLFPALSLLGYETPEKVDGCHGVMYAPPAVKEVYFWERVHTSSIPSA